MFYAENPALVLYFLIEGYVVLACELLAIRQLIPFVGSGTEVTAIIISGVLLPLAFGYHFGGTAYKRACAKATRRGTRIPSIRRILLRNILIALAILSFGSSYLFLKLYFRSLQFAGLSQRLAITAFYCILFLIAPVFLLGQTVPLTSNYFSRRRLSEITGKMLFFSTTGSFLGSVFSTIVLMSTIGVHNTVIVTLGLLTVLCVLLSGRKLREQTLMALALLGLVFLLNNDAIMRSFRIISDDAYSTIRLVSVPKNQGVAFMINNSSSSILTKDPKKGYAYVRYIEDEFISPLVAAGKPARDILVIGAGGFTMGLHDTVNNYVFVDIDPKIKNVAEKDFLHERLSPNKKFVAASARAFVENRNQRYDLIILDTYTNRYSIPMECTTREFLEAVKQLLKRNGIVVANIISSANFADTFTVRYDYTFTSVFPPHTRQIIGDYDPWDNAPGNNTVNAIYVYVNNAFAAETGIYTDDKNTYSLDRR